MGKKAQAREPAAEDEPGKIGENTNADTHSLNWAGSISRLYCYRVP